MVIEYVHSPSGQRLAKKVDGVVREKYFWSGMTNLLAFWEYDAFGVLQHTTTFDPGNGFTRDGVKYFVAHDQVGSVRAVIDTSGAIVKELEYDSFGNLTNETNTTFRVPRTYANGLHDPDTSLIRFGYRDYDPNVGRWTAKDPIFFDGGQANLYVYVGNSPVMYMDPYGLLSLGELAEALWNDRGENVGAGVDGFQAFVDGILPGAQFRDYYDPCDPILHRSKRIGTFTGVSLAVVGTLGAGGSLVSSASVATGGDAIVGNFSLAMTGRLVPGVLVEGAIGDVMGSTAAAGAKAIVDGAVAAGSTDLLRQKFIDIIWGSPDGCDCP